MDKDSNSRRWNKFFAFVCLVQIAVALCVSLLVSPYLPATLVVHWGLNGEPNGFASKEFALFFVPVLMGVIAVVLLAVPNIDPLKKNIAAFRKEYNYLVVLVLGFLLYLHIISILINGGLMTSMLQLLAPALGVLFFYLGLFLPKTKRNYFIGIRTPWTLSSDDNWKKTHRLGGKLFKASGVICCLGLFFPGYTFVLVLAPIFVSTLIVLFYSFLEFAKAKKK